MTAQIPQPEWFQLTQADSTPPRPRRNRVTRRLALSTPLLVLVLSYMVAPGATTALPAPSMLAAAPSQAQAAALSATAPLTTPTGGYDAAAIGSTPTGSVAAGISVMPAGGSDEDEDEGVGAD